MQHEISGLGSWERNRPAPVGRDKPRPRGANRWRFEFCRGQEPVEPSDFFKAMEMAAGKRTTQRVVLVEACLRKDDQSLWCVNMERITIDPEQCGGRPCIRGMRIRVVDVLDLLANGLTAEQILSELPDLEPEDIQACLQYASRKLNHPVLVAA